MIKPNGIIFYEGPSVLDGQPITVIGVLKSNNKKTGNMIQYFIIRSDVDPVTASKQKLDASICGACVHRQSLGGGCYVNIGQSVLSVYKAYKRGSYPNKTSEHDKYLKGRAMRFGSYGDPAAAPFQIWNDLKALASITTGYSHQLMHPNFNDRILESCMVSADTPKAALKSHGKNYRTFRVKTPDSPFLENEIECLADSEGVQCIDCGLCNGIGDKPNIAINVHGTLKGRYIKKYSKANIIAIG